MKGEQPVQLSPSYIASLPSAEAEPETARLDSILAFTDKIEEITESGRVGQLSHDVDDDEHDPSLVKKKTTRSSLISVRILKPSAETKVGIGFRTVDGELQISKISKKGPLRETSLEAGDRLVSLDSNSNTAHWTPTQAATYVRNATGYLSIVVRTKHGDPNRTEAIAFKSTAADKVGIGFKNDNGALRIGFLNPGGLLGAMCVLKVGDYVDSINSAHVGNVESSLALEMIKGATGLVKIRAKHQNTTEVSIRDLEVDSTITSSRRLNTERFLTTADEVGAGNLDYDYDYETPQDTVNAIKPGFISVKVTKATRDMRLGISFSNPTESRLEISSILDGSILRNSPLQPGCIVHSINNIRCRNWTKREALRFVKKHVGDILIMAQDLDGDPAYATALAYKSAARSTIGLAFKTNGGPLRVGNINPKGIFADSVLNTDDDVIAVNNINCRYMNPTDAVKIVRQSSEIVCVLTKLYRQNGVVLSHFSSVPGGDEYERAGRTANRSTTRARY